MLTTNEAKTLWDLVKPLETAMLITKNDDSLQGRPMHLVQSEFSGIFYFFSGMSSAKVSEIEEDSDICLAFSCPKAQTYVSVSGQANTLADSKLIDKLWSPMIEAWFPQGRRDPNVGLIAVSVYQAEFWRGKGNSLTQLFKYAKALYSGARPDIGEHGQMD